MPTRYILFFILLIISFISSTRLIDNEFFTPEIKNLVRKINRLAVSPKNEVIMNILIKRLKKYILEHDIDEKEANSTRAQFKDMIYIKNNFTVDHDGTYDILSHESLDFDRGYQVSFEREYDDYSNEEYDELVYKMALMSDKHAYLGVYASSPELSFHFDDLDLAYVLAILFNQYSIWDWSVNDEIANQYVNELS